MYVRIYLCMIRAFLVSSVPKWEEGEWRYGLPGFATRWIAEDMVDHGTEEESMLNRVIE